MIEYVDGDLFATASIKSLAHGCNCAGAMGKGIALLFKKKWPAMYSEYKKRCKAGEFLLGDVFVWEESGFTIFNLGTQKTWRTGADLEAIETSLRKVFTIMKQKQIKVLGLPRIGAGLGGLKWSSVKEAIERVFANTELMVVVCDKYVAGVPCEIE